MIQLIVGNKGSGKTKTLIKMANEAVANSAGLVVVVEKGLKLTYDINHKARLVDIEHYDVKGYDCLHGFLAGLMACNYDITHIFVDATLKIGGADKEAFAQMVDKLAGLVAEHNVSMTFTVSCALDELPASLKGYAI